MVVRCPAAAPLVFPTAPRAAADGTPLEALLGGALRGQPAWLTIFLSEGERGLPTVAPLLVLAPMPAMPPFPPDAAFDATAIRAEAGAFAPLPLPLRAPC